MINTNFTSHSRRLKVGLIGATGMVGRRLAELLIDHPWFEPAMFVGSESSTGNSYRAVWEKKEKIIQDHYGAHMWKTRSFPAALEGATVSTFRDLLDSDIDIIFSSLPERAGDVEARLLNSGRTVFSNSPYRRFDESVALVVAEVNGNDIRDRQLIKNPNCVTSGLVLVLAPIAARYGIEEVVVTTYQSLSGRGDARYPAEVVVGNVYPLFRSEEQTENYIRREVNRVIPNSFSTSVTCNRIYVQEGHFVEVRIKTQKPLGGTDDVFEVLSGFNPLKGVELPSNPAQPMVLLREMGRPRPVQDADHCGGMAIAVGNISTEDEVFDIRVSYVVNNLVRGAAGGALLNAELWLHQKKLAHADLPEGGSARAKALSQP